MQPVFTIGHSTHPVERFLEMLSAFGVALVADIRTIPRSRRNPQFNRESLPQTLAAAGMRYAHLPELGGLRHPRKDSINTGWRNSSFRGYADYMQTPAFARALDELLTLASRRRLAMMCAEAVPWRCHRSLVADALTARGAPVEHIMSATLSKPHTVTSFARIEGGRVWYPDAASPAEEPALF
jgi:uncharacterized protein (DUF488 family)